jgi:hypothetical protein
LRLSDRIGRKPIILGGALLAALTIFPVFHGLTWFANPALSAARANAPIVLVSDPADCRLQFNPTGTARFTHSCDVARRVLAGDAISYTSEGDRSQAAGLVRIGAIDIPAPSLTDVAPAQAKALEEAFRQELQQTIAKVGYPLQPDPAAINKPMVILLLAILMLYGAMTLGPISAALVEMFPTRIRYSAMSLPYHIGNGYFGGFLPAICFALVAQFGDIYAGLWYPVVVAAISCVIGFVFIEETRDVDIFADD